jgi:DNA-binding transcriptional LysR family regulator
VELSAKYAYQVYKEKSFSGAAKALQVSQPALSATVSRLEKELGIRIFDRSKLPLTLTSQGRIYIQAVEEMLHSESVMQQRLRQLSDMSGGRIAIGCERSTDHFWLTKICGEFHKRYPDIQLELQMEDALLYQKLAENSLDLVLSSRGEDNRFVHEVITEDRLFIAMRKDLPGAESVQHLAVSWQQAIGGSYGPEQEIEDVSVFGKLPFITWQANLDIARHMSQLPDSLKTALNAGTAQMQYDLMEAGLGAAVVTKQALLAHKNSREDILLFALKSENAKQTLYLSGRHSGADKIILRNFIQVAKQTCKMLNENICL